MSDTLEKKVHRWKGKIVREKVYEQRRAKQENGRKSTKAKLTSNTHHDASDKDPEPDKQSCAKGSRIIEFETLGQQLWCSACKEALSLQYIENEIRRGLGSELSVRCHKCSILNQICTSNYTQCADDRRRIRFTSNYKAVLGALHSGLGWTHLSKLCACMSIPCFDYKTYKRYEAEIREAAGIVAKKSYSDATALEGKLTLEQIEDIVKLL